MAKIDEFRQKYPEYSDMDDSTLARKLHAKSYSDMPYEEFHSKFVGTPQPASPDALSKIDQAARVASYATPLGLAARAGVEIARGGGFPYAATIPNRFAKGVGQIVQGLGPAIAAPVAFGVKAVQAGLPGPGRYKAQQELATMGRSAAAAAPTVAKEMAGDLAEFVDNPGGYAVRKPFDAALNVLTVATLPEIGLRGAAEAASRMGAKEVAKGAARMAEGVDVGGAGLRAAGNALKENPAVANWAERHALRGGVRDIISLRGKQGAAESERMTGLLERTMRGVPGGGNDGLAGWIRRRRGLPPVPQERAAITAGLMGTASPVNMSPQGTRAMSALRRAMKVGEGSEIERGLTPEIAARRAAQPQRMVAFGDEAMAAESAPRRALSGAGLMDKAKIAERERASLAAKAAKAPELKESLESAQKRARLSGAGQKMAATAEGRIRELRRAIASIDRQQPPNATTIARMLRRLEADAGGTTKTAEGRAQALMREIKSELERTDPRTAARNLLDKRLIAAEADAAEGGLLLSRTPPRIAGERAGKAASRLSDAEKYGRMAQSRAARAERLMAEASQKEGRVPALDRVDAMTEQMRRMNPDLPTPTYVPMIPKGRSAISRIMGEAKDFAVGRPGYTKRSKGKLFASGEFETDPARWAARHAQAKVANEKNLRIIDDVTKQPYSRPVKSINDVDWENEALIAPGMYSRRVASAVNEADDALTRAMAHGDMSGFDKAARGTVVEGADEAATMQGPFYAVPKEVAKELQGQLGRSGFNHPAMTWLFDKPNQFLRWTALTLRPGFYVNNVVGNTALATLSGASPKSAGRLLRGELKDVPSAVRGAGFAQVEAPVLGSAGKVGRATRFLGDLNEKVDDAFRAIAFDSEIDRIAAKKAMMETGERLAQDMSLAERMALAGPDGVNQAVKHVDKFLNDYARQAPWQKNILRKLLPFQSFLVHMTKLTARLPFQHPMRAKIVQAVSEMGTEFQNEQYKSVGVDPANVASYRRSMVPTGTTKEGNVEAVGTQGFSPASGFGFAQGAMAYDPSLGGTLENLVGQMGPVPKWGWQVVGGRTMYGRPLTKPGTQGAYGSDSNYDDEGNPIDVNRPSPLDALRMNTPQLGLLERLLQPKEPYDLLPDLKDIGGGLLPAQKDEPRRYGFQEAGMGYAGYPWRDFTRKELEASKAEMGRRKAAKRKADKRKKEESR